MSIKIRMVIGIVGAILFLVLSNLISQTVFKQTTQSIHQVIDIDGQKTQVLSKLKNLSDERALIFRNLILLSDEQKLKQNRARLNASAKQISALIKRLNKLSTTPKEQAILQQLKANMVKANHIYQDFISSIDADFKDDATDILLNQFEPEYQKFAKIIAQFKHFEEQQVAHHIQALNLQHNQATHLLWGVLILSIILFSVVGIFVARSFLKPINAMRLSMKKIISTGDLSHRIEFSGKDELAETARDMNALIETIYEAITEVNQAMEAMSKGVFGHTVQGRYQGDFETLKEGVNQSVKQISNVVVLLRASSNSLKNGELKPIKAETMTLYGDYNLVVQDLNDALTFMSGTVIDISKTLEHLSHGDFSSRVTADARGDFSLLKDSINITLENLDHFVEEVAQVQTRISEGDMTQRVKGQYFGKMAILKDSLNASSDNISVMIAKVAAVTKVVATESETIAHGNNEVSGRVQSQALALEQTATQMQRMTDIVKDNADLAQETRQMTKEAQEQLNSGVKTMNLALNSMTQMTDASQKINDITTLIDGIAFQTNLLALNAAVEAARAGEHGRGFAVVAGEVRNLAGKSADAASEIKVLIENSVRISEQSGDYVQKTSESLNEINGSMGQMAEKIITIADSSVTQTEGISVVTDSVAQMDTMTQQNAALVEETESGSQDLKTQASELLSLVSNFKIDQKVSNRMLKIQTSETAQQFQKMVEAHLAWKGKIRAFVEGLDIGVSYEVATDHTSCILGKWYYGAAGQELMHLPLMQQLGKEHEEMHQGIKKVMDAKSADDLDMVDAGLAQVDVQSEKVVAILHQLMDEVA